MTKSTASKIQSKKDHLFQIYLPLTIIFLLIILVTIFVIYNSNTGNQNFNHWANISIVFLIAPMLMTALLFLAILILIILGQAKFTKWIPIQISSFYVIILKIAFFFINGSNKLTKPIINTRVKIFSLKSIWKKGKN